MQRCLQLATLGAGYVAPNPMVGAVLVHNDVVIGEGYHMKFGGPHAEVNCINSVPEQKKELISESTLYVSLEPCDHFGKTPPCTELILASRIPKLVIAVIDPFEKVNGSGIEKLRANGVEVVTGVMEKEAAWLNRRFFTFHTKHRPYVILKWAQSHNLAIAGEHFTPLKISNEITDRLVHRWRSEEAAIMVGTTTALQDDPALTTRLWPGHNPTRVVINNRLELPPSLHLFDDRADTIILNQIKDERAGNNFYHKYGQSEKVTRATMDILFRQHINSLIVEGGSRLIQSFIDEGLWDEARVITNRELQVNEGIPAPVLRDETVYKRESVRTDDITYYRRNGT